MNNVKVHSDCKIYGPYTRITDGRRYVKIIYPNKKRLTMSYPKYLIECRLNEYLKKDETVDHIDGNFLNDSPENLRIVERSEHLTGKKLKVKEIIPEYTTNKKLKGTI